MKRRLVSLSGACLTAGVVVLGSAMPVSAQLGDLGFTECARECLENANAAVAECRDGGGSILDCLGAFGEAFEACREAIEDCDVPEPPDFLTCGLECIGTAGSAIRECRDGGGSLLECVRAYWDALAECRADAGCDFPEPPDLPDLPQPCGLECFGTAREATMECLEAGGSREECIAAYRDALTACREDAGCDALDLPELPDLPDLPLPCGLDCFKSAAEAVRDCLEGGGSLRDCAETFRAELSSCREAAGCGNGGDEGEEETIVVANLLASLGDFVRGDANIDGQVDISDAISVLLYLFRGARSPSCPDAADANDDGALDIADPTAILSMLFRRGEPLPPPSPFRGTDPTPDDLVCD